MFDELRIYLELITTPENTATLISACKNLEAIGILNHNFDLEQIMHTANEYSSEDNYAAIFNLIQEYLETTLLQFGVTTNPTTNLGLLNEILSAFLLLPNYGDPEGLLRLIEQELTSEELFCNVLAALSTTSWFLYAEVVAIVNPALIFQLTKVLNENVSIDPPVDISAARDWYIAIKTEYNPIIASLALQSGIKLNTPLVQLLAYGESKITPYESNPEELAKECLGLLTLSDTPLSDYPQAISQLLEHYAKDINVITKANLSFNRLLTEVMPNAKPGLLS